MRSPLLSKSKSEVSGQSGHCSARLLATLRAKCGREQMQQRSSISGRAAPCRIASIDYDKPILRTILSRRSVSPCRNISNSGPSR
jgi:hypothetical protein